MQIFENDLTNFPYDKSSVVTVGTFDGLHLGHQQLIKRVIESGSPSTVVTFFPHPQTVVARPGKDVKIITPPDEKVKVFRELGLERLVVLKFDRLLLNMTAEEFLKEILVKSIGLKKMIIGYDHAFGKDRKGDKNFLAENAGRFGYELEVVEPYYCDGEIVSSSSIRKALSEGDIALTAKLLGRRYSFSGWVIKGDCRGSTLGYPTANLGITPSHKMLPLNGVYLVYAILNHKKLPALLYIGIRPTYGLGELTVEVFLLDFSGDLYGEKMGVELIRRLRGDIAFESEKQLIEQMKKDEKTGREILAELNQTNRLSSLFGNIPEGDRPE